MSGYFITFAPSTRSTRSRYSEIWPVVTVSLHLGAQWTSIEQHLGTECPPDFRRQVLPLTSTLNKSGTIDHGTRRPSTARRSKRSVGTCILRQLTKYHSSRRATHCARDSYEMELSGRDCRAANPGKMHFEEDGKLVAKETHKAYGTTPTHYIFPKQKNRLGSQQAKRLCTPAASV